MQKGSILISEPYLGDPNFERTVVLLCEKNSEGAVGFVLNKQSILTLDAVIKGIDHFQESLYVGGPVSQESLHFIYRGVKFAEESVEVIPGLFWGGDYEILFDKIRRKDIDARDFRFFLGYSGWGPGQLEDELSQNSWFTASLGSDEIFDTKPEDLWRVVLKNMGGKYKMFSNYPIDPRLN